MGIVRPGYNNVEEFEKAAVVHYGKCNSYVYYRLSHDVVAWR